MWAHWLTWLDATQARWFGSRNHTISPYESAASAVHIALVSMIAIPTGLLGYMHTSNIEADTPPTLWEDSLPTAAMYATGMQSAKRSREREEDGLYVPIKYGSMTDRSGRDYVGAMPVIEWEEHEKEAEFLVGKCESLYESLSKLGVQEKGRNGLPN